MYEDNLRRMERRLGAGLELLKKQYKVTELPVRDIFQSFTVAGRRHVVRQFEIESVGNLLVMTNPDPGAMQMDTFTITPYFKNLPLFTTDYMYFDEHLSFLNEIYDLVEKKDERYIGYIEQFADNVHMVDAFEDMNLPPCWYDDIRPVVAAKNVPYENEDRAFELFLKNLQTFIAMEQESPALKDEEREIKWEKNHDYARALVEDGGVSTGLFVESLGAEETKEFFYSIFFATQKYKKEKSEEPLARLEAFFDIKDENGKTNREKVRENQKIIRRIDTTSKDRSFDVVSGEASGIVAVDGKVKGFGIHILNEDVYPLQSFEIYLRNCNLTGDLDLAGCEDMVFVDIYHNKVSSVRTGYLPAMRIFGVQDNLISQLDVTGMPVCQGIDAGMNRLQALDVSRNEELVELYINDNNFTEIDLSHNERLKYFYCQNNRISRLDTRKNICLRHLNATDNPMTDIWTFAPQRDELVPLELHAGEGGFVGLRFNPVYDAQWKETGEWEQSYHAYAHNTHTFIGWQENGRIVSNEMMWKDEYGNGRVLTAVFEKKR